MEWYEELDFDENPLQKETRCVGNEEILKEAYYSIISGNILVIEGETGSGKTKILKEVIKKFGGYGRIAYINAKELQKELNVEEILAKKNGILGWLFKRYPKNMILLLDDVEHLSSRNLERIKYFFDSNHLRSIIITTKSYEKLHLSESIKQRIRKNIQLHSLSEFEAVQVFRDKLGEHILSDRTIKTAYQLSGKNTQKFLNNCEHVCKAYVANKNLTEEDVRKLLERGIK
ncbi:MAG: ATP-binding protein [bacterium]|nr:ATP-binding protein [bacterium]